VGAARQRYSGDGVWHMDHSAARARRRACHVATDPRHGSIKVGGYGGAVAWDAKTSVIGSPVPFPD